jgi:hypothetical protein
MIGHAVRLNPLSFWLWRRLAHAQESVTDTLKVLHDAAQAVKDAAKQTTKSESNDDNSGKDAGDNGAKETKNGGKDTTGADNVVIPTEQESVTGVTDSDSGITPVTDSDSGTVGLAKAHAKPQAARVYCHKIARILLGEYVLCEAHVLCESGNATQAEERLRSVLSDWSNYFEADDDDDNCMGSSHNSTFVVMDSSPPKGLWCALLHVSAFGCLPQYMVRALGHGVCDKLVSIDWDSCGNVGEDVSLAFEEAFLG